MKDRKKRKYNKKDAFGTLNIIFLYACFAYQMNNLSVCDYACFT